MKVTKIYTKKTSKGKILFLFTILGILICLLFVAFDFPDKDASQDFSGPLPVIIIHTNGQILDENPGRKDLVMNDQLVNVNNKSPRFSANLELYEKSPYDSKNSQIQPILQTDIIINTRGQSSLAYPKKQYTVRLIDDKGFKNPQEILKMSKHDKWVLNGMYSDKSLMRNYIAYKMGRQTMEYSPNTKYVEVYIKTSDQQSEEEQYQGIYLLTEKIERDSNRVAIDKNDDKYQDISYIMARDKIKAGDLVLQSDWNKFEDEYVIIPKNVLKMRTVFTVSYPNKNNITDTQKQSITKSINDFEYALRATNFTDKREGYNKYIETDSFVKYAMINEITKNIDGGEVSAYFYKNLGEKIKAGPVWDFDQSLGNTGILEVDEPTGFLMLDTIWYERLFQDEYFVQRYKAIYKRYRNTIWNDRNIDLLIDQALLELGPAIERNNARWYANYSMEDYKDEIDDIRVFLKTRLHWIDDNINLIKRITENVAE